MSSTPLVSVIIPCFNSEAYLHTTIGSVLEQTYGNIEIIVIDDGSSDNTLKILEEYVTNGSVTLLTHPNKENRGVGFTRRTGINAASGKYIAFLDADDYFEPSKIEKQIDFLQTNQDAILCHTAINLISDVATNQDFEAWFNYSDKVTIYNLKDTDFYLKSNHISNSSVVIRSDVIKNINFESQQLFQFEDWLTWTLASEYGKFLFVPEHLTYYRYHDESATSKTFNNRLKLLYSHLEYYLTLICKNTNNSTKKQCIDNVYGMLDCIYSEYLNSTPNAIDVTTQPRHIFVEREQAIQEREQTIQDIQRQLEERDQQLAEKNRQIYESQQQVDGLLNSMSWKITAPLRSLVDIVSYKSKAAKNVTANLCNLGSEKPSFKPHEVTLFQPIQANRPRIVHALGNFLTGGSSQLVIDNIERLGHIYEQEVLVRYKPPTPSYMGVPVHEYRNLPTPEKIVEYFTRYRPSLVHVHYWGNTDKNWYEQVFLAAERYGCNIIENINTPVTPYVSSAVNHYVYVSNYVYRTFGEQNEKCSIVYPGSNFELFQRNSYIPDNSIGMVYRLEKDKLNEQSIDVFIKVAQKRPGTKMLIVGGGSLLEPYKRAVKAAGVDEAFVFTDYVAYEYLPALYEQMSIFVAPVWQESFGQVTPFAMNMGIAVVGYDVGALSEILGTNELLAPPGDSDMLSEIIVKLLDNREQRLSIGAYNRERAQQLFSVEAMVSSYERIYRKLLEAE